MICARGKTCASINFLVLAKGIKPLISLTVKDINPGDSLIVNVQISNEGDTPIEKCSGSVDIKNYDSSLTRKGTFSTTNVDSGEKETIQAIIESDGLLPGDYELFATIDCDGIIKTPTTNFTIGELTVKILNYTKELTSESIEKFIIIVESSWNDPLDIFAHINLMQGENKVSVKTTTEKLKPWATQELTAYVDTKGLAIGIADLTIQANYQGQSTKLNDKINIVGESSAEPVETIEKESETEKASNTNILTILLIVAVIILTSVNVYLAIRKKKQE